MGISAQILVYTAWLVVAIASVGAVYLTLARRDLRRDRVAISGLGAKMGSYVSPGLRLLRERFQPLTPEPRADFLDRTAAGVRVTLFLMVPILIFAYYWEVKEWRLAFVLTLLIIVPCITLPLSVAHTYLLRLIGARGPIVATAAGLVLGLVIGRVIPWGIAKPATIYGGIYGLIVGLGNTSIAAPGLIADERPRTLEEQNRADGL